MEQKIRGLIAYLLGWVGGLVVLFALKDNSDETKFNACQSITISVCGIIISIAASILGTIYTIIFGSSLFVFGLLSYVANIGVFVLGIIGMIKAYQEQKYEIPVISDLTRKVFKGALSK